LGIGTPKGRLTKLRQARRREGRHVLRTNLIDEDPARLWSYYLQLVRIEEAFRNLKGDLAIRPIFHQVETRVEAHIFFAFLAYCLHATLARRLAALGPGLTLRSVLEKFADVQLIDIEIPTTAGREIKLTRHSEPEDELETEDRRQTIFASRRRTPPRADRSADPKKQEL
jgi:hypothetical protein